jgi:TonB family protein
MKTVSACLRLAVLAGGIAGLLTACADEPRITSLDVRTGAIIDPRVRWIEPPRVTVEDMPRVMLDGVNGEATVSCHVEMNGAIADCTLVSETPPGMGFGAAAVNVARRGRAVPLGPEWASHPRNFPTRIVFRLED